MRTKYKILGGVIAGAGLIAGIAYSLRNYNFGILSPQGTIAAQQRDLMVFAAALSLLVIVPVFALTISFAYTYRASNTNAKYEPDWDSDKRLEAVWWGIPIVLICILSVVTWVTTHKLDPFKPLDSSAEPVRVQVVALQWKWLFIYPDYDIATVNYLAVPVDRPINFEITADAPMNSFWIPQLGGQIYAMSGMSTKLHLMADTPGIYDGYSANISGEGFAGMRFKTYATEPEPFAAWLATMQNNTDKLTAERYAQLAKPSENDEPQYFGDVAGGLYTGIVMKYMAPRAGHDGSHEQKLVDPY